LEIKLWEGGLQAQEVRAIDQISAAFSKSIITNNKAVRGGSLQDQLKSIGGSTMFPWKGYAGFRYVSSTGKEGEFDLVIVTHCNVLIVELKDWNNGEVKSHGDKWYKNNKDMGRSPVSVTQNKVYLLKNKLNKVQHQLTSKKLPWIDFFVVMCGNASFKNICEKDRKHTLSLHEFLNLADEDVFNKRFNPFPNSKTLNQDFEILDKVFSDNSTAPKQISVNGYKANEMIFEHPNGVYKEFQAVSEASKQDEALLRTWNFNNLEGVKGKTPEGRYDIVSREKEVLQYIKHHDHELYKQCLRSLTSLEKDNVTTEYCEVYELPPNHNRFNEFIGKYAQNFTETDRLNLVKLLIAKFADLHGIKVAHRDLGDHSLWISPGKEIALSNFISAYHQPAGTVGDYRQHLSVNDAGNELGLVSDSTKTPFENDVRTLGTISWHIINGQRISKKSMKDITERMLASDLWYTPILYKAIGDTPYANATELFEAFKANEPNNENAFDFDDRELDKYRKQINHSRLYREDDEFIVETDEKEVYFSSGLLVKAWLNVNPSNENPSLSYKVLHFLNHIEKINSVAPPYIPKIKDFGLASKSSSLYLVTDKIDGNHWNDFFVSEQDKLKLVDDFIAVIEHLHSLGFSHGDLHPSNVLLSRDLGDIKISLIDIPDFSLEHETTKNHLYSPENIDNSSAVERDNFAVIKMCCELLGITWAEVSSKYKQISDAVINELNDKSAGFKDLVRFKKALHRPTDASVIPVKVVINKEFEELTLYPDNGKLYLKVDKSNKNPSDLIVSIYGIGGIVSFVYSSNEKAFIVGFPPRIRDSIRKSDMDSCQLVVDFPILVKPGKVMELSSLTKRLETNEAFERTLSNTLTPDKEENSPDSLSIQLQEAFKNLEVRKENKDDTLLITTRKLWRAILDTETESYPFIEIVGDLLSVKDRDDQLIIPYTSDIDTLGKFNKTDIVEALKFENDKEIYLGEVVLKQCALNEVRIGRIRFSTKSLKDGDYVYFRTKQDKASFTKRKAALERILDKESVISNLDSYFEPDCESEPLNYEVKVSDDDFARYDRKDDHGNKISLNEQQRFAFRQIIQNGPLSMLQGPPGTGKTEFIAAFVHYLIEKQNVKRVLLVSQSHEAVNTAAERIRSHCSKLETPIDVVRFSNREGAVSSGLKDVYSNAIVSEKRALFHAESKFRVEALSTALGLEPEYLSALVLAQFKLFKQIDALSNAMNSLAEEKLEKDDQYTIKKSISELDYSIREILQLNYEITLPETDDVRDVKQLVINKLNQEYSIRPDESKKAVALAQISLDMLNVLETDRVNYDEFFARSRQLVTGTCVGIGQRHLGIADNQYDWVIIDEAARSIASELAIAMQSGKRVLLVGDHRQLSPLYSEAHKKALALKLGISDQNIDLDSVLQSDFARAFESPYGKKSRAALLTQYRMAPQIGDIVSSTFYKGELKNGDRKIPDIYSGAPDALKYVVNWLDTSSLGHKCYHNDDKGVSIYNRTEASIIINLLKEIARNRDFITSLKTTVKDGEAAIGIICMYAEQKRIIRQKFKEIEWADDFKSLIKIDTVDSYQGKENRIIILSITRSSKDQKPKFLRTPNRINVALSRAMDRLLIVGSTHMWKGRNKDLPLGQVLECISTKSVEDGYQIVESTNNLQGVK